MTRSEISQLKAQRLMLLGAMTEMPAEDQVRLDEARAALLEAIEPYAELGSLALALATIDWAIKKGADE